MRQRAAAGARTEVSLTLPVEPSDESRPRCATHGLRYDPRLQSGCVLCRRDAAAPMLGTQHTSPSATASGLARHGRTLLFGSLLVVLASAALGIQRAHSKT